MSDICGHRRLAKLAFVTGASGNLRGFLEDPKDIDKSSDFRLTGPFAFNSAFLEVVPHEMIDNVSATGDSFHSGFTQAQQSSQHQVTSDTKTSEAGGSTETTTSGEGSSSQHQATSDTKTSEAHKKIDKSEAGSTETTTSGEGSADADTSSDTDADTSSDTKTSEAGSEDTEGSESEGAKEGEAKEGEAKEGSPGSF